MSNQSVLVFISIQDKNMLTVLRLSQIPLSLKSASSGCSWAMNGMFCCGETVIWSSGACWITPESAFPFQGKRGFKHEHAGEVTVGTTCIRNLLIWSFGSKTGGAVDAEMSRPVYNCRYSQDRWVKRGRTVSEAPFRWLSTRKQIHKFSAVTGDTREHPLTQTKQGERGRLCCVSSLLVPPLRLSFSFIGQSTVAFW